ncbi:MAG: ABC transporter permease, partial [Deltaproteobacteria bacterium]|nr:ABC transporter permease [Deltaproteobacteria bacterium]
DQILIGNLLANNLKVGIQDELTLLGQGRDGSIAATVVKVKGIYSSGIDDLDRSSINMPLKYFQDVYGMYGAVHEVVVIGKSLKAVDGIKAILNTGIKKINPKLPLVVLDWKELTPGLVQSIELDLVSGIIFYFLLILVVAFSILNTFLMVIFERTREFGVLKALLIESISMTIIGIAAGIIAGSLITLYFQGHGIDISGASDILVQYGISGRIYPRLSLLSAFIGPCIVFIITFLAALYPALKIRSLRPVEAMTYV